MGGQTLTHTQGRCCLHPFPTVNTGVSHSRDVCDSMLTARQSDHGVNTSERLKQTDNRLPGGDRTTLHVHTPRHTTTQRMELTAHCSVSSKRFSTSSQPWPWFYLCTYLPTPQQHSHTYTNQYPLMAPMASRNQGKRTRWCFVNQSLNSKAHQIAIMSPAPG